MQRYFPGLAAESENKMTRQNKILILALRHALQHGQEDHITAVSDEILARRGELSRDVKRIIKAEIEQGGTWISPWVPVLRGM